MKKKYDIKNIVITVLCGSIIAMGVGFSVLSMQLEKYKEQKDSFDINFTKIKQISAIKGGEEEPKGEMKIEKNGNILNMDFTLYQSYDELNYEVTIRNDGTITATIVELLSSPDFKDATILSSSFPVSISISDINGKVLEPGDETIIKISALYHPTTEIFPQKELKARLAIVAESKKNDN